MKSLKTKVIMSAIVLVFALIATIGSTYAWFTVSNTVTVSSFSVSVESNEALLMKVWDGEADTGLAYTTYRTADDVGNDLWTLDDFSNDISITDSAIYTTGAQRIDQALFSPVTALTGETVTTGFYEADYTALSVSGLRKPTADFIRDVATVGRELIDAASTPFNSSAGGYIQIKIWVLNPASTVVADDVVLSYTLNDNNLDESFNEAIWIGTVWDANGDGNLTNDDASQFVFGDQLDLGFSWGPSTPGRSGDAALNILDTSYDTIAELTNGNVGVQGTSSVIQVASSGVPELLTINIWAEGWDEDTVNAIMGASYSIVFSFELKDL